MIKMITEEKLRRIKVDCLYGKKKHFNAADRKEKYHFSIGIPLVIINIIIGSVLLFYITDNTSGYLKAIPIVLAFIAAILSGFQTYFNFNQKVEGHKNVANKYLALMKKCDRTQAYLKDEFISHNDLIIRIEDIALEIESVNKEAALFSTSNNDYQKAKEGIESGEEDYTEKELNI